MIAACGVFPSVAVIIAWAGGSAGGDIKRGMALAMMIGVGNLGGVCSNFIYRTVDSPQFHPGHRTVIGCLIMSYFVFVWEPRNRETDVLGQVLRIMYDDGHIQTA